MYSAVFNSTQFREHGAVDLFFIKSMIKEKIKNILPRSET